jgi:drug/metabolite transporter (DMT)-like permease
MKAEIINFYFFLFMTFTFLIFSLFKKAPFKVEPHLLYWFLVLSVVSFIANYFNILSIDLAPNPGYVKAIQSIQIIFISVISYLLLGSSLGYRALL